MGESQLSVSGISRRSPAGPGGDKIMSTEEKITAHIVSLPAEAIADWAAGSVDEVMADALHAAAGVSEVSDMRDARRMAIFIAQAVSCDGTATVAEEVRA
jgi:hypothetical protein